MDDESRLVSMKGREYDPVIGRFLQSDPTVKYPLSTQGYNRYAYTDNNPLARIDPTGYGWASFRDKWVKPIAFTAAAIYTGGLAYSATLATSIAATGGVATTSLGTAVFAAQVGAGVVQGMTAGAIMGSYAGYAQGGNLRSTLAGAIKGGAIGGVSGGLYGAVNGMNLPGSMNVAANSGVSGLQSVMRGGTFKDGFKTTALVNSLAEMAFAMQRATINSSLKNSQNVGKETVGFNGRTIGTGGGRCIEGGNCSTQSPSWLGGIQGGKGELFGMPYGKGSVADYAVEAFGGPHDALNSWFWYNANGNANNYGWSNEPIGKLFGETLNAVNVAVATPFVAASVVPTYMYADVFGY